MLHKNTIGYEYGKAQFLLKTGLYTLGGISVSLGIGLLARDYEINPLIKFIMIPSSIISIFFLHYNTNTIEYKTIDNVKLFDSASQESIKDYQYPVLSNTLTQKLAYGTLISGLGLTLEYLLKKIKYDNILFPATITSFLVFSNSIYYGYKYPDQVSKYKYIAYSGLNTLCYIGFSCGIAYLLFGSNSYSSIMMDIKTYLGIPVFMLISACDTATTLEYYDKNKPDAIICATAHYLNYMNILIKYIKINKNNNDKKKKKNTENKKNTQT